MENHIKNFWDNQAKKFGQSHEVSWGDERMINLEIDEIAKYINNGDKVLDVGCANGYSALRQCERNDIRLVGVDFSEEMIKQALMNLEYESSHINHETCPPPKAGFRVGDVRKLDFPDNTFDVTYTTRCLINLPTWEDQIQGIKECIRVTRKGGKILLSEAFWEPLCKLNAMRQLCRLEPLVEHDFNRYIKKERLEEFLGIRTFRCKDFSSLYYLGSRLIRDLTTDISKYEGYSNPINEEFYKLEQKYSGGDFGIQQLYVILK